MGKIENYLINEINLCLEDPSDDCNALEEFMDYMDLEGVEDIQVVNVKVPEVMDTYGWPYDGDRFSLIRVDATVEYTLTNGKKDKVTIPWSFGVYTHVRRLTKEKLLYEIEHRTRVRQPFSFGPGKV